MRRRQPPPTDEPGGLEGLAPELALIAAMLRCAVHDARSQAKSSRINVRRREDAQRWLRDRKTVTWWLIQIGLPETTYDALLREAGLEEGGDAV